MLDQDTASGQARRRSVDVGGLSHAMKNPGLGHGWGGWGEDEQGELKYAELLSGMYLQTVIAVNENRVEFTNSDLPDDARTNLIKSVARWNFEPHRLPDEEVVSCTMVIFEALFRIEGMQDFAGVSLNQISDFVQHLRRIYREQNSYHNFHHALDVLQATYHYLCSAGMVPSVKILLKGDDRMWRPDKAKSKALLSCLSINDIFTLYIAAIGHDVGHPGFTNNFMKNAKTPLSAVYDDKSPLEHMHCALLLRVMRDHGLSQLLDRPEIGNAFRKLLQCTVLATDMSVHGDIMTRFTALIEGEGHFTLDQKRILLCQALIKCADISNPSRPHRVSQYWAGALMEEWTCQASLEKHCQLPSTVSPAANAVGEAKCQVWFITHFAKPLLDLTVRAVPQLRRYSRQCAINLKLWEHRSQVATDPELSPKSIPPPTSAPKTPDDFLDAFPLTLPISLFVAPEEGPPTWTPSFLPPPTPSSSSDASSELTQSPDPRHIDPAYLASFPPSQPISPCDSTSSLLLASPKSEFGPHHRRCPSGSGSTCSTNDATAALRVAWQASVRKKKSFHRSSWSASAGPDQMAPSPPPSSKLGMSFVTAVATAAAATAAATAVTLPGVATIEEGSVCEDETTDTVVVGVVHPTVTDSAASVVESQS